LENDQVGVDESPSTQAASTATRSLENIVGGIPHISDIIARQSAAEWEDDNSNSDAIENPVLDGTIEKAEQEHNNGGTEITNSSPSAIGKGKQKAVLECVICSDPLAGQEAISLPCVHYICKDCIQEAFIRACKFENHFPPRCCSALSLKMFEIHLPAEVIAEYHLKTEEYTTPAPRNYCSNWECREFLRSVDIKDGKGGCPKCAKETCTVCGGEWHPTLDCSNDMGIDAVLKLAEKNGWPRCPKCRAIISKSEGCHTMPCDCGTVMCYSCGKPYVNGRKDCRCRNAFYTEADAAMEILDLEEWEAAVSSCKHDKGWQSVSKAGDCTQYVLFSDFVFFPSKLSADTNIFRCHTTMPTFIYQCRFCKTERCRRCSGN